MSRQFSRIALAGLALLAAAAPSRSAVLTFTDLASWQAAVGASPTFVEGFEGFASDTSYVSAPVVAGPLTLSHTGPSTFRNIIDVVPLQFGSTITTNAASA